MGLMRLIGSLAVSLPILGLVMNYHTYFRALAKTVWHLLTPGQMESDCIDRISSLPDDMLLRILSLLHSTNDVIRTRVLSTRWNDLYASIPDLGFDDFDRVYEDSEIFTSFVTQVLLAVIAKLESIHTFRVYCNRFSLHHSLVSGWISEVSNNSIQELIVSIILTQRGSLPSELFHCTTLVNLKLSGNFVLDIPMSDSVVLPSLKNVALCELILNDANSLRIFLCGCQVLESLYLFKCVVDDNTFGELIITSQSLKVLDLLGMSGDYELKLVAPRLVHFLSDSYAARGYSGSAFSDTFYSANFHLELSHEQFQNEKVYQLVSKVSKATSLVLTGDLLEALLYSDHPLPKFSNMTELSLGSYNATGWESLPQLLNNAPILQYLSFYYGFRLFNEQFPEVSDLFERVPTSVSSHLKEVTFQAFGGGDEKEIEMVEYLLKNCKVLEKIAIFLSRPLDLDHYIYVEDVTKRLLACPRLSETCQIEFYSDGDW